LNQRANRAHRTAECRKLGSPERKAEVRRKSATERAGDPDQVDVRARHEDELEGGFHGS